MQINEEAHNTLDVSWVFRLPVSASLFELGLYD
jgi:hypothetical protein